jgi:hypothetical protein
VKLKKKLQKKGQKDTLNFIIDFGVFKSIGKYEIEYLLLLEEYYEANPVAIQGKQDEGLYYELSKEKSLAQRASSRASLLPSSSHSSQAMLHSSSSAVLKSQAGK